MNGYLIGFLMAILTISLFITQESLAQNFGIGGTWYHNDKPTHVNVNGYERVVFINEDGDKAVGHFVNPWKVNVPKWGVNGTIENGGRRIAWTNGTTWTRYPEKKTHVSGRWYHGDKPTYINVYDNGWKFSITNEFGETSDGTAQGPHTLYVPSLSIYGHVNRDATVIRWTNGPVWTRYPDGNGSGPLRSEPGS